MLTSWLSFVMSNCMFVTFPCGILGQVWYLIVSIPDLCPLSYFSPFLTMGETFALSHSDGRDPSSRDLDKMTCRFGSISWQSFCSSRGQIC